MRGRRQRDSDLGFGSVVADSTQQRLLNRDGSFNVVRKGLAWRHAVSLYYTLLSISWPRFVVVTVVLYLGVNLLFAGTYVLAGPQALTGALSDRPVLQAFFFSVHTLSTVGYGNIVPANLAANILVTLEITAGLFGVALVVGLVFARFSRPVAAIAFSRSAVVAPYRGGQALMFRIANLRRSQIIELQVKVSMSRAERGGSGGLERRFYSLELERSKVDFFPLSWTIVHPIDENSPLHGYGQEGCENDKAEFLILLMGTDETFSQSVHVRTSYLSSEVIWNARFERIFEFRDDGKVISMDVGRISDVERLD